MQAWSSLPGSPRPGARTIAADLPSSAVHSLLVRVGRRFLALPPLLAGPKQRSRSVSARRKEHRTPDVAAVINPRYCRSDRFGSETEFVSAVQNVTRRSKSGHWRVGAMDRREHRASHGSPGWIAVRCRAGGRGGPVVYARPWWRAEPQDGRRSSRRGPRGARDAQSVARCNHRRHPA